MDYIFIYLTNGFYFGFISNGFLYSRDGIALAWIEGSYVWDFEGKFRGVIAEVDSHKFVVRPRFKLPPVSRPSRAPMPNIAPIAPPSNIKPINLGVEFIDAFESVPT